MATMFNPETRRAFKQRIARLQPDTPPRWGRMNAGQMVCHLADQLRLTFGELTAKPMPSPLRYPVIKQLVMEVLPWPKGRIVGPPEGFTTTPGEWQRDVTRLLELLDRFEHKRGQKRWPQHPMFGAMTGPRWGRFTCRHFDHHLTQFGV